MNLLMHLLATLISTSVAAETPRDLHISVNVDSATGMVAASILREVYKQTKLEFCIVNLPPLRATKEAKAGNIDGEVLRPPNYAASHPELIRIDPPYIVVETLAYTLKARNLNIQKKSDLKPLRIGVVRGIINAQNATEGLNDITFADSSESLFKMLTAGRIDAAVDSKYSADRAIKKTMINELVSGKIVLLVQPAHHYLNIKHKALATSIAATISQLANNGELQRLATIAESEQIKNDISTAVLFVKNCS